MEVPPEPRYAPGLTNQGINHQRRNLGCMSPGASTMRDRRPPGGRAAGPRLWVGIRHGRPRPFDSRNALGGATVRYG